MAIIPTIAESQDLLPIGDQTVSNVQKWLIPNWLPSSGLTILETQTNLDARYLAVQIGIALSHGLNSIHSALSRSRLKFSNKEFLKVLTCSYYDSKIEYESRLWKVCSTLDWPNYDYVKRNCRLLSLLGVSPIWSRSRAAITDELHKLVDIIFQHATSSEADLIILDPSVSLYHTTIHEQQAMMLFVHELRDWARHNSIAILAISLPLMNKERLIDNRYSYWQLQTKEDEDLRYYQLELASKDYEFQQPILLKKHVIDDDIHRFG